MNSSFKQEIPKLLKEGVITQNIALKIENYYRTKQDPSTNKLFTIFGAMGSLLVGLGVILILAHNWDNFSRSIKTIFAFTPLIIGQIIVGYSIIKKRSATWLESSGVFLFFAVGSSISLISQIYNTPGNIDSFLLIWLILCIPLVYLLQSKAVLILSLVFSTFYAFSVGFDFSGSHKNPWMYLLLIAAMLPYYLSILKQHPLKNSTTIFNWLFPLSIIISLGTFLDANYQYSMLIYLLLFGLLYNIGKLNYFTTLPIRKNGYLIFGSLGFVIMMLFASSEYFWNDRFYNYNVEDKEILISILLITATIGLLVYNSISLKFDWIKNVFNYAPILMIMVFLINFEAPTISIFMVNILIIVLGVSTIKKGINTVNFGVLNYGLLIITALVIARFFDTKLSFIIRGLLFIIVGVGFFTTNYIMFKKNKKIN